MEQQGENQAAWVSKTGPLLFRSRGVVWASFGAQSSVQHGLDIACLHAEQRRLWRSTKMHKEPIWGPDAALIKRRLNAVIARGGGANLRKEFTRRMKNERVLSGIRHGAAAKISTAMDSGWDLGRASNPKISTVAAVSCKRSYASSTLIFTSRTTSFFTK